MIRLLRLFGLLGALYALLSPRPAAAQDPPGGDEPTVDEPPAFLPPSTGGTPTSPSPAASGPADFSGALQTLRAPAGATDPSAGSRKPEIFPDARRVWMSVRDTDPRPIEAARRGGPASPARSCLRSEGFPL